VQLVDRDNSGVIAYDLQPKRSYRQLQNVQPPAEPPRKNVRIDSGFHLDIGQASGVVTVFYLSATSGTCVSFAQTCLNEVIPVPVISFIALPETAKSESQVSAGPVLEMRPAHRSLQSKAQEEMSDFEREYPW
jgi:hypothetical protein